MVCIEKRPYTLYGRLATLHFRYLTCLLDRGHIIVGGFDSISLIPLIVLAKLFIVTYMSLFYFSTFFYNRSVII